MRSLRRTALLLSALLAGTVTLGVPSVVRSTAATCDLRAVEAATPVDGDLLSAEAFDGAGGVWGVGVHYDGGDGRALAVRGSAGSWNRVPVPLPRGESGLAELADVAVVGPDDAWAVGSNGPNRTVIVRWDGLTWRYVAQAPKIARDRGLLGVSAISADDVWAVGRSFGGTDVTTLVEHWGGSGWSVVNSPSPSPYLSVLEDVIAIGPSDVWAVGYRVVDGRYRTLTEHWDGSAWTVVETPDAPGADDLLVGVAATGPADVWAVGWTGDRSDQTRGLALHWDGSSWSSVDVPDGGSDRTRLLAVTVGSGGPVAVGQQRDDEGILVPLALRWSGQAWTSLETATLDADEGMLVDVTADGTLVAVGTARFPDGFGSVVETGC